MDHLASFEAAAQSLGIDPTKVPDVTGLPEAEGKATVAAYKLFIISKASWRGQPIDWNDYSQRKYYPWWDLENYDKERVGSVSGFSFDDVDYDNSDSNVGSRLCYPDRATVEYVAKQHIGLYRDMMAQ